MTSRLCFAFCALAVLTTNAEARTLAEIKSAGTIEIATEGVAPPFNYFEGTRLTGFEVELADAIAKRLGLKTHWKTESFGALLIGLKEGRYDWVVASHAVTKERAKAVDFLRPHYCSGGTIVSRKGGPRGLKDLTGKTVAAQVSSIYPAFLEKLPGIGAVKTYPQDTDLLQSLMAGKVDAAVSDKFLILEFLKKNKGSGLQMGDIINPERDASAVNKGNADLRDALDKTLAGLMKDGTYAKLSRKYFGEDIRCK